MERESERLLQVPEIAEKARLLAERLALLPEVWWVPAMNAAGIVARDMAMETAMAMGHHHVATVAAMGRLRGIAVGDRLFQLEFRLVR